MLAAELDDDQTPLVQAPPVSVAIEGLIEACSAQFGIELTTVGSPTHFDPSGLEHGAKLSLIHPTGSWELALLGRHQSCVGLTREVMAHDSDDAVELAEIVDTFGEALNMVSGLIKRRIDHDVAAELTTGIPMMLEADECARLGTTKIPAAAQRLHGASFDGELVLFWSDRSCAAVALEVLACLEELDPADRVATSHTLALLEEFEEISLPVIGESTSEAVSACHALVLALINGDDRPAAVIEATVSRASEALREFSRHSSVEPLVPRLACVPLERDEETVELLTEFLQEAEDGLDQCDELLMQTEQRPASSDDVNALFRVFHSIKGTAGFLELEEIAALVHRTETLLDRVRSGQIALAGPVLELVLDSTELTRRLMTLVRCAVLEQTSVASCPEVEGQIDRLQRAIEGKTIPNKLAVEPRANTPAPKKAKLKPSVKVEEDLIERLEGLIETLGALAQPHDELRSIVDEFREVGLFMRMVPVAGPFQKMSRMVRDLAKKTGKLIRAEVEGQDTKLGREALERLADPLVHMIRNAVDHGIEDPEARARTDKPAMGTIGLRARHEGEHVVIEISDDGKGLDPARLRSKAESRGLIEPRADLSLAQLHQLIFEPGFSTASTVTSLSGRGVGMDVVRSNIAATGGSIEVRSELGRGTAFLLRIPLG